MRGVSEACAWFAGLTFLFAGVTKVTRPGMFADELADYVLLPRQARWPGAVAIICLELGLGAAAIAPASRVVGCVGLLVLVTIFSGAVVANLARGRTDIACGCFGRSRQTLSWHILVRNTVLGLVALAGIGTSESLLPTGGGVVVVALGLLGIWLVTEYVRIASVERSSV